MRLKLLTILVLLVLAGMALSQAAVDDKNKTAQQNATARQPSPYEFIGVVLIMALFALTPLIFNNYYAHQHLTRLLEIIRNFVDNHKDCKDDEDKIAQIIHEGINADPFGSPGTARGVMALTLTLIVGTALFFLVTYPPNEQTATVIKEVLLTLTGALTSIIGFYFGGKGAETKPTEPKPTEATGPVAEKPKAEKPKAELYTIKEDIVYQNKQYPKGTMDLANIPANIRDGWLLDKKIEPYVGEQKEVQKELKDKPGWYTIKTDFHYPTQDDLYIKGNVENLTNVPASILADWKKNGWVEPYKGPVE